MSPRATAFVLASLLLAWARPVSLLGQTTGEGVGAWAGPTFLVSKVAGDVAPMAGAEAGLSLGSHVRLAGAGYALLGTVRLDRPTATPLRLSLGYGGVVLDYLVGRNEAWHLGAGLLMGAGTARIRDPVAGVEIGADNFVALEPRVTAHVALRPFLQASFSARFRIPWALDDLPGFSGNKVRGAVAGVSISVGSFRRR